MGYIILEDEDTLRLAADVQKRMTDGWRPLGGVACYYHARREVVVYAQALVREPAPPAGGRKNG